jgi:hypothetical protein
MRTFGCSVLALAIALAGSQAFAANHPFSKTSGPSPDGSGAQVVVAGAQLDAHTLAVIDREVRETYQRLHPDRGSYMVLFGVNAEGKVEATALPYAVHGQGPVTQATGPQPPTPPPPPGGSVPVYVNRVDLHVVNYNGWNRDTSYGRDVTPSQNGGWTTGPWGDPIDDHVYQSPGGGRTGCGGTGERPCPQQQ